VEECTHERDDAGGSSLRVISRDNYLIIIMSRELTVLGVCLSAPPRPPALEEEVALGRGNSDEVDRGRDTGP
jgi:hypothetical protein